MPPAALLSPKVSALERRCVERPVALSMRKLSSKPPLIALLVTDGAPVRSVNQTAESSIGVVPLVPLPVDDAVIERKSVTVWPRIA